MQSCETALSVFEESVIADEEAWLAKATAALVRAQTQARAAPRERISLDALRRLREEANAASADDLPPLLHELSVRQSLRAREADVPLPDPRAPYVAHLRVEEGGATKDYFLGRASFLDAPSGLRIVDWRIAPVAQIFYRYREGDDYEEPFPGRVAEGVVVARRITVIEGGVLLQVHGDGVALARDGNGTWGRANAQSGHAPLASGGAGSASTADVTALLDADQFAAISEPPERPLVVLGSAGSGKTTVALHRLARIAARDPAHFPVDAMGVVVPEEGLARLSRRLLAPLGVGDTQVRTLDRWFHDAARRVFGKALPPVCAEPPALVASLKRHPALYDALRARLARRDGPRGRPTFAALRALVADALTDRPFLTEVVAAADGALSHAAIEETVRHTMMQLSPHAAKELRAITDASRKEAVDGLPIWEGTPSEVAGTVDLEELPVLLAVRAWRGGKAALDLGALAHLVLDEAEDFSLFDLFVLAHALGPARSVTLAGDGAQQTSSSFAGFARSLETLGVAHAVTCTLAVSYRCPAPVVALAREVLGALAPEVSARAHRDGPPIGNYTFPTEPLAHLFLSNALRELIDREPRATVGVLARDVEAARRLYEIVRDRSEARLVLHGEFTFTPGIDVTDVDSAKGLEFDYVVVPDATAEAYPVTDEARRRLHVAVTRTSHGLWVVAPGRRSALLPKC